MSKKILDGKSNFECIDSSVDRLFSFLINDSAKFRQLLNADALEKLKLKFPFFGNGLQVTAEKFELN